MLINLKVKTLDARTHEFSIDNEITIRQFKDQIAEKTNIAAENQRIIYQGRVLADEKKVREYDVDGKVLHVAERPPFSQRGANARNNDEPRPMRNITRPPPANMRNSPFFRALDGMLVGTMAIPVNNGPVAAPLQARATPNRFPNSSSFCINRITVALHMIDCANNIAAYLENPEVGLNNQSLDILQRGRWTMESTVVEVGVSSTDLPRNNNIIDMVQDAVTAALSRNTNGRNYTVVQLPTVYTNEGGAAPPANGANEGSSETAAAGTSDSSEETTAAAVIIEDVLETDDEAEAEAEVEADADVDSNRSTPVRQVENAEGEAMSAATAAGLAAEAEAATDNGSNVAVTGIGPRRRTRPQVLANVIDRYRNVQTRLAPFVELYYNILQEDPAFEENNSAGREGAQRIFDRVSEAFHYLSHAQHAISDLMLDLSQAGPRVLTCRPILVEQSGYIRSNNIFTPNMVATPLSELIPPQQRLARPGVPAATEPPPVEANRRSYVEPQSVDTIQLPRPLNFSPFLMARAATRAAQRASVAAGVAVEMSTEATAQAVAATNAAAAAANASVEDPVDEPMVATGPQQRPEMDPQTEMARLIQAVVNNATNEADVHVEFNAPNIMSINLPVHVMTAAVQPQGRPAPPPTTTSTPTPTSNAPENASESGGGGGGVGAGSDAASTSSGTRSGEQRANTLPTTATQTRSTARPQIQIGGNNNWAGRIAPTHTAFDRFLPCNSHHIREPETPAPTAQANGSRLTNAAPGSAVTAGVQTTRTNPSIASAGSGAAEEGSPSASSSPNAAAAAASSAPVAGVTVTVATDSDSDSDNLRGQVRHFLFETVFEGGPINEETIPPAIGRVLAWLGDSLLYLQQYERPEYNAHDSVCNIVRPTLRRLIELCTAAGDDQFEQRLKQLCEQFRMRLYSVLCVCMGRAHAELYWRQLMRMLATPLHSNFRNQPLRLLCIYIDPTIPANADVADAQQFLVLRSAAAAPVEVNAESQSQSQSQSQSTQDEQQATQALDSDIEMAEAASGSSSNDARPEEALPAVNMGAEPWHASFPNDWLPVITRDLQAQTEQTHQQPPYSDAYISGMSAKRRKIIQSEKPGSSVECLIASGVQQAIQTTGVGAPNSGGGSGALGADAVIAAIAHDAAVQSSYTEAMRTNACERLKKDADYKASKYPQTSRFAESPK